MASVTVRYWAAARRPGTASETRDGQTLADVVRQASAGRPSLPGCSGSALSWSTAPARTWRHRSPMVLVVDALPPAG